MNNTCVIILEHYIAQLLLESYLKTACKENNDLMPTLMNCAYEVDLWYGG